MEGKVIMAVLTNFSKAFDTVSYETVLTILDSPSPT